MENLKYVNTNIGQIKSYILMILAMFLFIFSIDLLIVAVSHLNSPMAENILLATKNPFVSLFIGLLMTALIQSSSTVTSSIVAVVASGHLGLEQAVPMVMGANIGTTLTSTLISLSYLMKQNQFRRAFSAGMLHDIFNTFTVLILLPLEIYFGFLSKLALAIAHLFIMDSEKNPLFANQVFTRNATEWISQIIGYPVISLILAILLIFGAIKLLSSSVYSTLSNKKLKKIYKLIFKDPYLSLMYGVMFTATVQSSTVTTSFMVPLVANKKVSLKKAFPFIIGANIGTTITAAIAAIHKSEAAIALAIVHFLFNLVGAMIFMPIPSVRNLPVRLAAYIGSKNMENRLLGFAYILLTFFIIPFLLIYFSKH